MAPTGPTLQDELRRFGPRELAAAYAAGITSAASYLEGLKVQLQHDAEKRRSDKTKTYVSPTLGSAIETAAQAPDPEE